VSPWWKNRLTVKWWRDGRWDIIGLEKEAGETGGAASGRDPVGVGRRKVALYRAEADGVVIEVRLSEGDNGTAAASSSAISSASVTEALVTVTPGALGSLGSQPVTVSGIRLALTVDEELACVWKPHLAPKDGMAIGDKAFRSPAIAFEDGGRMTALVPDLNLLERERVIPHVMDYTLEGHELTYGLCDYEETGHVYYALKPRAYRLEKQLRFGFSLVSWHKYAEQRPKDYRAIERFLWERYAAKRMAPVGAGSEAAGGGGGFGEGGVVGGGEDGGVGGVGSIGQVSAVGAVGTGAGEPFVIVGGIDVAGREAEAMLPYVCHAYEWALDRWADVTWQQFELDGREVGGVVFLVRAVQKPGFGQENAWREPKSLWNQAWFCGLRTAYGYALWGRKLGRSDWGEKAELALNFALAAPQQDGLFPGYYRAGDDNRWESGGWVMSGPRRPDGHEAFVHLLDASWTCHWLLKWHRDVRADERILPYVTAYAERLLSLQREDGSFPAWVKPDGTGQSAYLAVSPENSAHVMLLCLLNELAPDARFVAAAERAMQFVLEHVVPEGRWEDFETYWSCSRQWGGKQYWEKDARSGLYNQCNFGMYWTAEALKELYRTTGRSEWLDAGEQVLAEASLYQQIWQPSYIPVPTIGGFGVMTSDDEWNDARQSLFALTYLDYWRLTGDARYRMRAFWAMKSSFYMMYCPENETVKPMYERVHPHFDEGDFGFHMENFNHHDGTPVDGLGEFTIFDWGCGAAAASLAEYGGLRGN